MYVPALYHLLHKYSSPVESRDLYLSAQILLSCGGYVEAGFIGYPDGFWWNVLMGVSRVLDRGPYIADIPINVGGRVHDSKFVFSGDGSRYGIIACEEGNNGGKWLDGAAQSAASFSSAHELDHLVFLVRSCDGSAPATLPGTAIPLIVDDSADELVRHVLEATTLGNCGGGRSLHP